MPIKVVQSGKELEIRPALDYLERMYGIPPSHVRSVSVAGKIGEPMAITVTVYVQQQPEPDPPADVTTVGADGGEDIRTYMEIQRVGEDAWKAPKIS